MERETEIYEDFVLKIKKEELCPDYIIRHLTIINVSQPSFFLSLFFFSSYYFALKKPWRLNLSLAVHKWAGT